MFSILAENQKQQEKVEFEGNKTLTNLSDERLAELDKMGHQVYDLDMTLAAVKQEIRKRELKNDSRSATEQYQEAMKEGKEYLFR